MIKYLTLALCLLAVPANAGSVAITITNDAGATVGSKSFTVSTAHLLRLITAMKTYFGQPGMTNSQTINAWLDDVMSQAVVRTRTVEATAAANAAEAAITSIDVQ